MKRLALIALLLAAAPAPKPAPSPGEIVAAAPASDWITIPPSDLLVMDLVPPAQGPGQASAKARPRRVVIQLMPPPFSQGWVGNIRTLAAAHWYDGTSINRVQDNYVVQWGDATETKTLPSGLVTVGGSAYSTPVLDVSSTSKKATSPPFALPLDTGEYGWQLDPYTSTGTGLFRNTGVSGFSAGWPVGYLGGPGPAPMGARRVGIAWPVHCYGMVGVGRGMSPDTGSGAELYTVIGHAPRHLDRNIALVGRVIEGIEHLSSLPRGTGALGFYETAEERVPILSVQLANEVKDLPAYQYLSTESETFARYADARANRRDPFFIRPAGGADICNIPVPVRRLPEK